MREDDRRLIEDYLPIQATGTEAPLIQDLAEKLDHAKREVVASRFFEIPAEAIVRTVASMAQGA